MPLRSTDHARFRLCVAYTIVRQEANLPMQRSFTLEHPATEQQSVHIGAAHDSSLNADSVLDLYIPEALYWEKYYSDANVCYEWNNGQLESVPMTDNAKYIMYLCSGSWMDCATFYMYIQSRALSGWRCPPRPPFANRIWDSFSTAIQWR